ncbi:MAG TPA: four helix bundle protein [Patescibacteria group bacterium]|nr:four helix bundle protein [Patescibacteria group bacterium]
MPNDQNSTKYDLEERTARFGESTIKFCKNLPRSPMVDPLVNQLISSATSVGANYCEADNELNLIFNAIYIEVK